HRQAELGHLRQTGPLAAEERPPLLARLVEIEHVAHGGSLFPLGGWSVSGATPEPPAGIALGVGRRCGRAASFSARDHAAGAPGTRPARLRRGARSREV